MIEGGDWGQGEGAEMRLQATGSPQRRVEPVLLKQKSLEAKVYPHHFFPLRLLQLIFRTAVLLLLGHWWWRRWRRWRWRCGAPSSYLTPEPAARPELERESSERKPLSACVVCGSLSASLQTSKLPSIGGGVEEERKEGLRRGGGEEGGRL